MFLEMWKPGPITTIIIILISCRGIARSLWSGFIVQQLLCVIVQSTISMRSMLGGSGGMPPRKIMKNS